MKQNHIYVGIATHKLHPEPYISFSIKFLTGDSDKWEWMSIVTLEFVRAAARTGYVVEADGYRVVGCMHDKYFEAESPDASHASKFPALTEVRSRVIRMDVQKFFKVICKMYDDGKFIEMDGERYKEYEFGIGKFKFEVTKRVEMTVQQILHHPNFRAHETMQQIADLLKGKQIAIDTYKKAISYIGDMIDHAVIYPDSCRGSFYFDGRRVQNGCGYNGGIILHDLERGEPYYGMHT